MICLDLPFVCRDLPDLFSVVRAYVTRVGGRCIIIALGWTVGFHWHVFVCSRAHWLGSDVWKLLNRFLV